MKLQVFHRTHFAYAAPVHESFNEARLRPATADGQVCHQFILNIAPATRVTHYLDLNQNCVHLFDISEPHTVLNVEASSVVTTSSSRMLSPNLATTPLARMGPACATTPGCYEFLQSSKFVDTSPEAWKYGVDASQNIADAWQAAQAIMHDIHQHYIYKPASTHVHTHMRDVLRERRGVCQDFAHVMIGVCRTLKIPARYASGYLYNGPVDKLRGAQASHAWVEVYLPELGWHGLDPTNGQITDDRYVKIGVGRDYGDVPPLRGTFRGPPQHKLTVDVLVTSMESVPA